MLAARMDSGSTAGIPLLSAPRASTGKRMTRAITSTHSQRRLNRAPWRKLFSMASSKAGATHGLRLADRRTFSLSNSPRSQASISGFAARWLSDVVERVQKPLHAPFLARYLEKMAYHLEFGANGVFGTAGRAALVPVLGKVGALQIGEGSKCQVVSQPSVDPTFFLVRVALLGDNFSAVASQRFGQGRALGFRAIYERSRILRRGEPTSEPAASCRTCGRPACTRAGGLLRANTPRAD